MPIPTLIPLYKINNLVYNFLINHVFKYEQTLQQIIH